MISFKEFLALILIQSLLQILANFLFRNIDTKSFLFNLASLEVGPGNIYKIYIDVTH